MYEWTIRGLISFCSYLEFQQPSIFLHQPKLEYFCIGSIELRIHRTGQLDNLLKLRVRPSQQKNQHKMNCLEWTFKRGQSGRSKVWTSNLELQRDKKGFLKNGRNWAKVDDKLNFSGRLIHWRRTVSMLENKHRLLFKNAVHFWPLLFSGTSTLMRVRYEWWQGFDDMNLMNMKCMWETYP